MKLIDANLLIYAHDASSPFHAKARPWLEELVASREPFLVAWTTVLAFLRITTHRKLLKEPFEPDEAFEILEELLAVPACRVAQPGDRFWSLFQTHCQMIRERGSGVMDVELVALAIEYDAELQTVDRGFGRFPGLRYSNPLEPADWVHESPSRYRYEDVP